MYDISHKVCPDDPRTVESLRFAPSACEAAPWIRTSPPDCTREMAFPCHGRREFFFHSLSCSVARRCFFGRKAMGSKLISDLLVLSSVVQWGSRYSPRWCGLEGCLSVFFHSTHRTQLGPNLDLLKPDHFLRRCFSFWWTHSV